jgi:hypothetical protein
MYEYIKHQYIERVMHLLVFYSTSYVRKYEKAYIAETVLYISSYYI